MTPAYQSIVHPDQWPDCNRAALASVLEVPTASLPHFEQLGEAGWFLAMQACLAVLGLGVLCCRFPEGALDARVPMGWVLVSGLSGAGSPHMVVGRITPGEGGATLELVHDPFPWEQLAAKNPKVLLAREELYRRAGPSRLLQGTLADWMVGFLVALDPAAACLRYRRREVLANTANFRAAIQGAARG